MRTWIRWGSFFMLTGVMAGAFGAHALKNTLTDPMKAVYETAVRYQLIHGLALFVVAWLSTFSTKRAVRFAGLSFCVGIFLFSGSLYALALTGVRACGNCDAVGRTLLCLIGWSLAYLLMHLRIKRGELEKEGDGGCGGEERWRGLGGGGGGGGGGG